jgi:hypothetical protein
MPNEDYIATRAVVPHRIADASEGAADFMAKV